MCLYIETHVAILVTVLRGLVWICDRIMKNERPTFDILEASKIIN